MTVPHLQAAPLQPPALIKTAPTGSSKSPLHTVWRHLNIEGTLAIVMLLVLWQYASWNSSPMFFPSLQTIARTAADELSSTDALMAIGITYLRILNALAISFLLASLLGVAAAVSPRFERFIVPLVELKQGIPAVCWILFAILWFRDMETRIAFVVITTALPSFFYQARDAVRGVPRDLVDMVRAFRPSLRQLLTILVIPAMLPSLLTVWRINIGNATRVTIMAELLGGMTGIGHRLRLSQEMFRMDQVIVWTGVLVVFVIASNQLLSVFEHRVLRWRATQGMRHA